MVSLHKEAWVGFWHALEVKKVKGPIGALWAVALKTLIYTYNIYF